MRQIWVHKDYRKYLTILKGWLGKCDWSIYNSLTAKKRKITRDQLREAFNSLAKLWKHPDAKIHSLIQSIYLLPIGSKVVWEWQLISCNLYLRTILCTELIKSAKIEILKKLSEFLLGEKSLDQQTLNVEDKLRQFNTKSSSGDGCICDLQRISVKFMKNLFIYPLDSSYEYPKRPGVYFIYYIGQTALYDGQVKPSTDEPVYVGMSEASISVRLKDHHAAIYSAVDLKVDDFIVQFMLVDIKYYASCIEGMLIERLRPKWNNETGFFSFGNASSETNDWNRYHIQGIREHSELGPPLSDTSSLE